MRPIQHENLNEYCQLCGKTVTFGNNKPHSLHKTRRIIKPNLQKTQGMLICTRCLRTLNKYKVA